MILKKVLVLRPDRLGDVVLSTPVLFELSASIPNVEIVFAIRKHWASLFQYSDPKIRTVGFETSADLESIVELENFDAALVLQDTREFTKIIARSNIPFRVGPYSKFHSFFVFNHGVFQKRSHVEFHEAEYNLKLLKPFGISTPPTENQLSQIHPRIQISAEAQYKALGWLKENQLEAKKFVVIHPGASGSSRYISTEKIIEMTKLVSQNEKVLLTAGPGEQASLQKIVEAVHSDQNVTKEQIKTLGLQQALPLDVFAGVLGFAKAMFAHSTGPLHVAAALGVPVFAPYPFIRVQSAKRWGPLGRGAKTWTPVPTQKILKCSAFSTCFGSKWTDDGMDQFEARFFTEFLGNL